MERQNKDEDFKRIKEQIQSYFTECSAPINPNPVDEFDGDPDYEHNHFMLIQKMALYFLMEEENKEEERGDGE